MNLVWFGRTDGLGGSMSGGGNKAICTAIVDPFSRIMSTPLRAPRCSSISYIPTNTTCPARALSDRSRSWYALISLQACSMLPLQKPQSRVEYHIISFLFLSLSLSLSLPFTISALNVLYPTHSPNNKSATAHPDRHCRAM